MDFQTPSSNGYYRDQALKVLSEAFENYDVDGLFFNTFGNQLHHDSGHEVPYALTDHELVVVK